MKNIKQNLRTILYGRLRNLTGIRVSPNSDAHQGVQARTGLPASYRVALGLLTSFGVLAFFGNSAYAASYINVSSGSGGTVYLGSIKPSATGVSASGSDTLTITTNCSAGYSVYVSAQNGGDTNLTNTNSSVTSNNTISASSTAVGSTATALNSNTWGITGDASSASASKYVGLPSYADATNTALISNSSASTTGDNKSTIYYGVKVDTTLSPGTYSGDVLYTTLVTDVCNNYTVKFNANGGTGTMNDQTIPVGIATDLSGNTFTRENYNFLGWSTSALGKTGTATDGIGTESDVEYKDKASVTDLASFNSSITLYAIWEQAGYALSVANGNSTAVSSITIKNNTTGKTLASGSPIPEGNSVTVTCTNNSGYHCAELASSNTNLLASYTQPSTTAVTLAYTFTMPAGAITLTGNGAPNTYTLYYHPGGAYGSASSVTVTYGTDIAIASNSFSAPSGWSFASWNTEVGDTGTTYSPDVSVAPQTIKSDVATVNGGSAYLYATWDIPNDGNKGNFQTSNICTSISPGHTATLTDVRDNQTYTVYRFVNSGTAGTDYPTNMSGYCIMTQDLALGYVTGGSITKGSNLVLSTDDSAGSTTLDEPIYNRVDKSTWDGANSDDNLQYVNGPSATGDTYSAHSYYSYGAARKVCPAGWSLPTELQYDKMASFMGNGVDGSAKIRSGPYNFIYNGLFLRSHGLRYIGTGGYNTSITESEYSSQNYYYLWFDASTLYTVNGSKSIGMSVRCVQEPVEVEDCSDTVHPTTTTGCKMKDDNIWILGNSGNTVTWNNLCTSSDNCKSTTYCPSGYTLPTKSIYDTLISKQGSSQLYSALGSSGRFWSTTQSTLSTSDAEYLYVSSSGAYTDDDEGYKTRSSYVLCYK